MLAPFSMPQTDIDHILRTGGNQNNSFFRIISMYQKIAKSMLDNGLISLEEYNKLTELNRQTFSPFLAEIMPKMT